MRDVRPVRVNRTIRWMASLAVATLLVGGGIAVGANLTSSGQTQASLKLVSNQTISSHTIGRLHLLRRLLRVGGEHGQITFKTKKGSRTVAFERGLVQSATSGTVVVKAADGTTMTWHLASKTVVVRVKAHNRKIHIRKIRAVTRASASALATGQRVFVVGAVVGGADNARLIIIRG